MNVRNYTDLRGRKLEYKSADCDPKWGYKNPQTDSFGILYPRDYDENKTYPLCVVFHSAGHDIYNIVDCLLTEGNHDVYHVPDDMFGLFLDCRTHAYDPDSTDWWWGGRGAQEHEPTDRSGVELKPVEKRCFDTIDWTISEFPIDTNRIYGVGNSMGGSGALGLGLSHGNLFAALKVNVPAGVYHAIDRCALEVKAPEDFTIPEPPVVLDYSAQDDTWSNGHEHLYRAMRENDFALIGFWGRFGHENNHSKIAEKIDIVEAFDIYSIKKNEAYPVFTNATTDDKNPWENDRRDSEDAGQVNGYFRWKVITDTENEFAIELRLLAQSEWKSRLTFPTESTADITLRRLQSFKADGCTVNYTFGNESGTVTVSGAPKFEKLTVTTEPKVLKITK